MKEGYKYMENVKDVNGVTWKISVYKVSWWRMGQTKLWWKVFIWNVDIRILQAGLSWECVLNKRKDFKKAYDNFDINKICKYDDKKIRRIIIKWKINKK